MSTHTDPFWTSIEYGLDTHCNVEKKTGEIDKNPSQKWERTYLEKETPVDEGHIEKIEEAIAKDDPQHGYTPDAVQAMDDARRITPLGTKYFLSICDDGEGDQQRHTVF